MSPEEKLKRLLRTPLDFQTAQSNIVEMLQETYVLSRVNILVYNASKEMLEAVSSIGHPQLDWREIRTPVFRMQGFSSRACQARAFLEQKIVVVRNREKDPEYRQRHKFPHKSYSREFAIFPLTLGTRKLGVLSIAVDDNNPTRLLPPLVKKIGKLTKQITKILFSTIPKMPTNIEMRKTLKEIFHQALLYSVYQPIVDVKKKDICGYEALIRVNHPLVRNPETLFHYAERLNELRDLAHFSHARELEILKELPENQKLFLNLTPKDFEEYLDLERQSNPLHQQDLSKIVFEITEQSYAEDAQRLNTTLKFYKNLGAGIAIDDLGKGYSSLEMLTTLEPNYLKLDISLVRQIHQNEKKEKLVKTLLYYGEQIGCECVAEGVETKAEFEVLSNLNCRLMQGYFIAPPSEKLLKSKEMNSHLEESLLIH